MHKLNQQHRLSPGISEEIEALGKLLNEYARKLNSGPNEKAAKGILKISSELSAKYELKLLRELHNCFRTNAEQELWKRCFHAPMEALRKQSTNAGPHSALFKEYLLKLLDQSISFYEALLKKYEAQFDLNFDCFFHELNERKNFVEKMDTSMILNPEKPVFDSMTLRSAQRHLIYIGDLQRYKVQNQEGSQRKNYSLARSYYHKAHILEPMNGHPFNGLAVVATYEKKWIDVLFYYVRALSVRLPFESARESLELALNSLRVSASTYEKSVMEKADFDKRKNAMEEKGNYSAGPLTDIYQYKKGKSTNYQEVWTHPGWKLLGKQTSEKQANFKSTIMQFFSGENGPNVQKRALAHILATCGTLISTIGIEEFKQNSQLLLAEFEAFILTPECVLNSSRVLKIILLFTFPVHCSKKGASQTLIKTQKLTAIEIVLSLLEILLKIVCADLDKIGLYLLTGRLSKKFMLILPSLCFAIIWVSHVHKHMKNLNLSTISAQTNTWNLFAEFCNKLHQLMGQEELMASCHIGESGPNKKGQMGVILPEFLLTSPYFDVLPKDPMPVFFPELKRERPEDKDIHWLTVQARFVTILHFGKQLANDESFPPLKFDAKQRDNPFKATIQPSKTDERQKTGGMHKRPHNPTLADENVDPESGIEGECEDSNSSFASELPTTSSGELELKKLLLSEEELSISHRWIVHVNPKYLVPDTNTFIDHLDRIKELVSSQLFHLLVPTIVIDELSSLTLGVPITGSTLLSRELLNPAGSQSAFVMERSKAAMEWLRDASEQRVQNVRTVTSNGNILQKLSFAIENVDYGQKRSNDDRILSVCVNVCRRLTKLGAGNTTGTDETHLERKLVLLTEDRGLSAKAMAEKIPVRTIPSFADWISMGSTAATEEGKSLG